MNQLTNTEANPSATLPSLGKAGEPPKGLGRDSHKPLMRNCEANDGPSPKGNADGSNLIKTPPRTKCISECDYRAFIVRLNETEEKVLKRLLANETTGASNPSELFRLWLWRAEHKNKRLGEPAPYLWQSDARTKPRKQV